ncbi:hemagglutinin repeat-containing protein [Orbus sturtevantii]|uniref:hemagglutinin repeat-containing protein n=1 Tax=Orbus sturtevantii TaxID=3074109 RepID=UPI00370D9047
MVEHLTNTVDSIHKIVTTGTRYYQYDYYAKKGRHYNRRDSYAYNPLDEISAIDLGLSTIKENTSVSSTTLNPSERTEVDPNLSISTIKPNTALPNSSLYKINKDPQSNYLIETDSRFTNKQEWLSSDYMLKQIKNDPNNTQKRLGDGYYEQQLIKDQIIALTGQRYLGDYSSDMEQYKNLMNAGAEFANTYGVRIGVALTDEQMKLLTSDMVWMVSKTVTVDGQDIEVLVPQVYIVNRPQVTSAGALVSAKNVVISSDADIRSSGAIAAKDQLAISANTIHNQGSLSGASVALNAVDSILSNGSISADSKLSLTAGNDVNLITTTRTAERETKQGHDIKTVIDRTSSVSVKNGDMVIKAGHDINTAGALLINQDKDGSITLDAGNNINLGSVNTRDKQEYIASRTNYVKSDVDHVVGSEIYSQGNINLKAGSDINVTASTVNADNALGLAANNININSQSSNRKVDAHLVVVSKSTFSKTTNIYDLNVDNTVQTGSSLSGKTIDLNAKKDITVTGSQVVGSNDINLSAGNNVVINSGEESYYQKENTTTKTSGLMSSGGIGFTYGKEKESTTTTDTQQGYQSSTVGSTEGNVTIKAGQDLTVKGSDIIAKKEINLTGNNVTLEENDAKITYKEEYEYEKSGLTLAMTGTAADVYEAGKAVEQAKKKDNDKLLALQSIKAGLTAIQAIEDSQLKNDKGESQASIGVSVSVGTQKTERIENREEHSVMGSGVSAGDNITITATGNEQNKGGDITVKGSEVKAGQDISLEAGHDVNLIGAVNTQHSDKDEKSYGGSFGLGLTFGSKETGLKFSGNANFSRERENADGSAWSEGVVDAGKNLTVKTGNDTNLIGGQLKGDSVKLDVGNNLNIESLQDTDNYDYDKLSTSISGSYTYGSNNVDVNVSISKTEMESNWASVTDQSGVFAGKGGFDVTVGNNTDLKGAVIASTADDKSKNKLDTGTISFENIENKADFNVDHVSISVGVSKGDEYQATGGMPSVYHNDGKASSTTKSAVEEGSLVVRNQDEQQQNVDELSRNTDNANNPLGQIFDKQKEQDRMDTLDLVKDIAAQAKDVVNKYDRIQAQNEVDKNKDELAKAEAKKVYDKLSKEDKEKISLDDFYKSDKDGFYYSAVDTQLKNNQEKGKTNGGMGSSVSKGIDAATAIISGLVTGDITGGLAGASAPYLAEQIKKQTGHYDSKEDKWKMDDPNANLIAHAILGAAVAAAQGNSALAGGIGAASGEAAAEYIRKTLYDDRDPRDLTQAEKENISALAQLASGLAVAAGSGSIADAGTAVAGSKNAVENNYLNASEDKVKTDLERQLPYLSAEDKEKAQAAINELNKKSEELNLALKDACQNLSSEQCGTLRKDLKLAGESYDGKLDKNDPYYHYLQSQYKDQYDGYKEINSLEFDLALKDVEAYREWKAQQLTENYGFSIETSRNLVFWERVSNTAMAAAAAIVGPKVVEEATGTKPPVNSIGKGTSTTANKPNNIGGEIAGEVGKGTIAPQGYNVDPNKFDYFFGRVTTGNAHNVQRSAQNLKDLNTLGIKTEQQLVSIFNKAAGEGTIVSQKSNNFGTTITKSMNVSDKGAIQVSFFYPNGNLNATPKVTTLIPKLSGGIK